MKIENTSKPAIAPLASGIAKHASGASSASRTTDDVELSGLSAQLLTLENAASFDVGRVAEIKQAIAEGRFSINAQVIAERLIASAKELIDSRQG